MMIVYVGIAITCLVIGFALGFWMCGLTLISQADSKWRDADERALKEKR